MAGVGEPGWYGVNWGAGGAAVGALGASDLVGATVLVVLRSSAAGGLLGPVVQGLEGRSSAVGHLWRARW